MAFTSSLRDPNTLANYNAYRTSHIVANLNIDFEGNSLAGNVVLSLKCQSKIEYPPIVLDTSHLAIENVQLDGEQADFKLCARVEPYGSALEVKVPPNYGTDDVKLDVGLMLYYEYPKSDRRGNYRLFVQVMCNGEQKSSRYHVKFTYPECSMGMITLSMFHSSSLTSGSF